MRSVLVDNSRWKVKVARVQGVTKEAMEKAAALGADILLKRVIWYVTGPHVEHWLRGHPAIGGVPIPRRTGHLAQSIRRGKVAQGIHVVWSDGKVAPYNRYVHDGTKYMRPRPFIAQPAREKRNEILRAFVEVLKEIRKEGTR